MSVSSKGLALGSAVCVLVACGPYALAQPQQTPPQGAPQFPQAQSNARPSPMRDFQDMIESQRSQVRDRIAGAIGRIEGACREELRNFCSTVTPGEGRLLLCMQAHEDKLSNQCELALFDASRNIQQTMQKIGRVAEACWTDIQMQCGGDSSIRPVHQRETRQLVTALPSGRRRASTGPATGSATQPVLGRYTHFQCRWRKGG